MRVIETMNIPAPAIGTPLLCLVCAFVKPWGIFDNSTGIASEAERGREVKNKRKNEIALSEPDLLAMYRCFLYTKMGVRNDERKPTDKECLDWLQRVMAQAEHRTDGRLLVAEYPPLECLPLPNTKTAAKPEGIRPVIRRFDFSYGLPDWRVEAGR